jgi:hypothetical protein
VADTKEPTSVEADLKSALDKLDSLLPAPTGNVSANPFWVPGKEAVLVKDGEGTEADSQHGVAPPRTPPQNFGPSARSST